MKSAKIVLPAYNDSRGVTESFNKNVLNRVNQELGGNFNIDNFLFEPVYDEGTI